MKLLNLPTFLDHKINIDKRGILTSIDKFHDFNVRRFYLIEPKIGFWRGKHYHKQSTQIIVVLAGRIDCRVKDNNSFEYVEFSMDAGQSYYQDVNSSFAFKSCVDETKIIVFCDKQFDSKDYYEMEI